MKTSFLALLEALDRHGVAHVVVGGVAAILEGAPVATLDLDLVYRVDDENLARLERTLVELEALYRDPAGRRIAPTAERLRVNRTNLLMTRFGPLDVMQTIGAAWSYREVADRAVKLRVANLTVDVLRLDAVIESKRAAGREKDRAMLPLLLRTLDLRQRADSERS